VHRTGVLCGLACILLPVTLVEGGPPAIRAPERPVTAPQSITSPVNPSARPIPIEDLFYTKTVAGPTWSPDGKWIAFTANITGRLNLWKVPSEGGWPIQMGVSDDRQLAPAWSPDGKWIVYQQDKGGNEIYDLFAVPSDGGEPVNLTRTDDISETSPHWSPQGEVLAIGYKPRTASAVDLGLLDWSTRRVRNLTQEKTPDHVWNFVAWSPDGKSMYAVRANAGFTDADVYRIDVQSGDQKSLTAHQGEVVYTASSVSPDGKTLLIGSNEKNGVPNVALLDLATGRKSWVTDLKWEAQSGDFSPDGKWFTYQVNTDGRLSVYLRNTASGHAERLALPEGLNGLAGTPSAFSPDGGRLLISHQSSNRPADFWIYDRQTGKPKQLTFSALASLNPNLVPQAQLVHYKSFDGLVISAFLWMPFNLKRDGSNPGVVLPHGGPTGQTLDSFNRLAAALASRGYVTIAPNVRGSTGYGIEFQKANRQDLGGGDLQDEVYAARFLEATGYVHPKKIGIAGGSYGGFMTLMAIGKTPDVWAAGVEMFGIINWFSMLQHEDPLLQQYEKSLLGDPVKDHEVYENCSPLKYIRQATAPLLVLQGENDIRVPKEEAEQVVNSLRQAGKRVEAHYYPNEGHGFAKRENQIDSVRRTVEWFDKYLK
jgi:dipeptidyl aminopeptidase/acylaminoacyl peptidase